MFNRNNLFRFSILLLLIINLSYGCIKVGPDFTTSPVTLSKNWTDVEDKRLKTESEQYRSWWRVFNDPILDNLIETAYRENLSLRIAGVRVLQARAQLGIAVGEWYPQTQQLSGSEEYDRLSRHAPSVTSATQLGYSQDQIRFGGSWELDFWGKFRRAIESADANLRATVADYDNALVSLTGDVANSYILIRTLEKRIDIAYQNVEIQKESLNIAEVRFSGGTTSGRDVEQAKSVLFNTQALIPTLETQLRQAKNALSFLLGKPPSLLADLLGDRSDIPAPPSQVAVGIPADLLRRRPDIRSAEMQATAQCAQIGVAKADLFPAFSFTGNFGFLSSDVGKYSLDQMFQWNSRTSTLGPTFQWNILNYGQITNQVRVQDALFQGLLVGYQNAVLKAQQEVEDALVAFLQAQDRAGFLAKSTEAAKNSVDLAVLQYRHGISDFTTVLTAQQALLNEQDSLANTLGDISRNLVGIYRALGGGWQIREGKDFVPESTKVEMRERTNWGGLLKPTAYKEFEPEEPGTVVRPPDW